MPLFQYINILPEIPEELRIVDLKELEKALNWFLDPNTKASSLEDRD